MKFLSDSHLCLIFSATDGLTLGARPIIKTRILSKAFGNFLQCYRFHTMRLSVRTSSENDDTILISQYEANKLFFNTFKYHKQNYFPKFALFQKTSVPWNSSMSWIQNLKKLHRSHYSDFSKKYCKLTILHTYKLLMYFQSFESS